MLRSILAIICGYLVLVVLVILMTFALAFAFPEYRDATEREQPPPALPVAINLVVGTLFAAVGGFVTGAISRRDKRRDAMILAGLIFGFGLANAAAGWDGVQPGWYLVLLPVLGGSAAALGGRLHPAENANRQSG